MTEFEGNDLDSLKEVILEQVETSTKPTLRHWNISDDQAYGYE